MITEKIKVDDYANRVARSITRFVENPVTNLVKGGVLLLIGLSDASVTFRDDVTRWHVRLGHGLVIIGLFSILGALPYLIDGLDAGIRCMERRQRKDRAKEEADIP